METPKPIPPALVKNDIYTVLSPISGGLAFLGNCVNLVFAIVPGLPFLCATINGLFSLGALATGIVGLVQIRHTGQKGKGLAVAGIVLGVLGLMAACIIPLLGTALLAALGWQVGDALLVPVE
ncbi:MAG: DUF4190 domain-containing protein [Chloroflexi bacterium]|nr:DUF4190 domain-containing protein [Chloroflexota bacterium]